MKDEGKQKGHFVTRINAADVLARFFGFQFDVRGGAYELRKQVREALGLYSKNDLEKLEEELDRLQGQLAALRRKTKSGD